MTPQLMGNFWMALAAVSLSLAWLLPNHYPPWTSFHADAWAGLVLGVMSLAISVRARSAGMVRPLDAWALALAALPFVQLVAGIVTSPGTAWIYSAYLLGLAIAIHTGRRWEMSSPGQCSDFLFLAVTIAAVLSTILQLYQLFGPEEAGAWVMSVPSRRRLFANVAQPNQLASLQLLAVVGCSWFYVRQRLMPWSVVLLGALLLLGVALTGSRTAWVNVVLLAAGAIALRRQLGGVKFAWGAFGLAVYFVTLVVLTPTFYHWLSAYMDVQSPDIVRIAQDVRMAIWRQFVEASALRPWSGFGWGQTAVANFQVVEHAKANFGLYNSTHNLLLDLVIWNGYPIALCFVVAAVWWFTTRLQKGASPYAWHQWAFLGILMVHSMLEFPLHYAFFLLPFGMVLGVLDAPQKAMVQCRSGWWMGLLLPVLGLGVALVTMRDYLAVERAYYGLRFEVRGIQTDIPSTPPDTWVLSQFHDYFRVVRIVPHAGMDPQEIQWMRNSLGIVPSPQSIYNLAASLALNGRGDEAMRWLNSLCLTMVDVSCEQAKKRWANDKYSERTGVVWPQPDAAGQ